MSKLKVGDKIVVLNDNGVRKTVTIHSITTGEKGNQSHVTFESGVTTHLDTGRQEPFYLTYPTDRIAEKL